jgi:putative heme iron utilization protein
MTATEIHRKESLWPNGINALRTRHGALIDTLTTLSDFRLFLLAPSSGRYIVGFGQAYELKAQSLNAVDHQLQGPTGPQK